MTIDTQRVAEIAGKLTEAQKRTLLGGRLYYGRGYWPLYHALSGKGLVATLFGHPLTPLGTAVRNYLKDNPNE